MLSRDIHIENAIAKCMLDEMLSNEYVRKVLQEMASHLVEKVLKPFYHCVFGLEVSSFQALPPILQTGVSMLIDRNLASDEQFGALLPEYHSISEVTNSMETVRMLFDRIEHCLINVDLHGTRQESLSILKCINEIGWCYLETLGHLHSPDYEKIKKMIRPTSQEFYDVRISRAELEEPPMLAKTFGIGKRVGVDLVPASTGTGWSAGKSVFFGLSMEKRFEILTKSFDSAIRQRSRILQALQKMDIRESAGKLSEDEEEEKTQLYARINLSNQKIHQLHEKMKKYRIPLNEEDRKPLSVYAEKHKTTFEKYTELPCHVGQPALPVIASVSGSTSRPIITLQDTEAFYDENREFDFNKAQIIANCLMAFFVWGGHHSLSEVAEIYNRLLDYISIEKFERLPSQIRESQGIEGDTTSLYTDSLEEKLPYYRYGNYASFLHPSYANAVMDKIISELPPLDIPKEGYHKKCMV